MKRVKGLFRLGALTLLALTLMAVMALPAAAADVCSSTQMLDEVGIVRVAAKAAPAVWSAQDLANLDHDGDIENGLLEVVFRDIPTSFDFDGYVIEAAPGDDDPGDSDNLGVPDYRSPTPIARPAVVGSTVTAVLNLEPGTKYYVTVYAVNHNTVQISPDQRAQDSSAATTLLSAPFPGALEWKLTQGTVRNSVFTVVDIDLTDGLRKDCPLQAPSCNYLWREVDLEDDDYKGTHFALHGVVGEAGQHYFRWLNPAVYGPFDHLLDVRGTDKQADMLSYDKDGEVETHCTGTDLADGDCGHTHYRFRAVDDSGNTVASELVETGGMFSATGDQYFESVFTAGSGELTLSVSLGRLVGGKYRAMSDTASVTFEAPDDLRALDQTFEEYERVLTDIVGDYDENDDAERWLGEDKTGDDRSIWNPRTTDGQREVSFAEAFYGADLKVGGTRSEGLDNSDDGQGIVVAHLNNQLK